MKFSVDCGERNEGFHFCNRHCICNINAPEARIDRLFSRLYTSLIVKLASLTQITFVLFVISVESQFSKTKRGCEGNSRGTNRTF